MIGIFGGTFDPVHNGHLRAAAYLLEKQPLSHIRFIPCYQPAHRKQPVASAKHRLQMLELATQNEPRFVVDDCEIKRKNTSYMIDTLQDLKKRFPEEVLALIVGYDAWQHFTSWHRWEAILKSAHVIIVSRPNYTLHHPTEIPPALMKNITIANDADFDFSATRVRSLLKEGPMEMKQTMPASLLSYIAEHALYGQ
jgi:nicotinate-nucleotide adenylyltransferase